MSHQSLKILKCWKRLRYVTPKSIRKGKIIENKIGKNNLLELMSYKMFEWDAETTVSVRNWILHWGWHVVRIWACAAAPLPHFLCWTLLLAAPVDAREAGTRQLRKRFRSFRPRRFGSVYLSVRLKRELRTRCSPWYAMHENRKCCHLSHLSGHICADVLTEYCFFAYGCRGKIVNVWERVGLHLAKSSSLYMLPV